MLLYMQALKTNLEGVLIIEPQVFEDERGFFAETFQKERYREIGITDDFVQDNLAFSKKGVLRGLHYQKPPHAQGKLVSVLRGKVFDVAVDIRFGSPTFGKSVVVELSGENKKQLWIPKGFAHGYLTLEDNTLFFYKCTNSYAPESDAGVRWDDPDLAINWPLKSPVVSEKDQNNPFLKGISRDFDYLK